jgi:hypothetical protein
MEFEERSANSTRTLAEQKGRSESAGSAGTVTRLKGNSLDYGMAGKKVILRIANLKR